MKTRKNNKKKGAKEEIKGFYNMTAVPKVFLKLELVDGGMISVSAYAEVHHSEQVTRKIKKNATVTIEPVEETEKAEEKAENVNNDEDNSEKEDSEEENKESEDEKVEGEDNNEEKKVEKEEEKKEEEKKAEDEFEVVTEWVAKRVEVPLKIKQKFGPLPATLRKKSKEVIAELDKAEKLRVKIQESKNELEGKIYSVKNGIEDSELIEVTTEEQRSELRELLSELSDWVEYEAERAELLEIREKKNSLDKLVKPIYLRITEKEALPREGTCFFFESIWRRDAHKLVVRACQSILLAALNVTADLTTTHEVKESDMEDLRKAMAQVTEFLDTKQKEQSALKVRPPTVWCSH